MSRVEKQSTVKIPDMDASWLDLLQDEFTQPYMDELRRFLKAELKAYSVYPESKEVFTAFKLTPFQQVKVVVLGQDPYHGKGQAHGLCFSVKPGCSPPPSLQNIFKELCRDVGLNHTARKGDLRNWSRQGVFLLNTILTVRASQAASHRNKGWETFTDRVITLLNERRTGLVFLLWGKLAQEKEALLDATRHKILRAAHPSPFSANHGFFGCRHFSLTNAYLREKEQTEIDWDV